jgi:hypothetical protein
MEIDHKLIQFLRVQDKTGNKPVLGLKKREEKWWYLIIFS